MRPGRTDTKSGIQFFSKYLAANTLKLVIKPESTFFAVRKVRATFTKIKISMMNSIECNYSRGFRSKAILK